jgi:hypothetical protein
MTRISSKIICAMLTASILNPAFAAEIQVTGKITATQGHVQPQCRMVFLKRNDNGTIIGLRLGNYTNETSISAITIAALTSGLNVTIDYDPAINSGCGTEPALIWIQLTAPGY